MRRARLKVTGRVQGVYYRASTREQAKALGLVGWVRNSPDGAVEIEAQGRSDAVDELVRWCHQGPPAARVSSVVETPIDPGTAEVDFSVRY